jgi:hypothetical protein
MKLDPLIIMGIAFILSSVIARRYIKIKIYIPLWAVPIGVILVFGSIIKFLPHPATMAQAALIGIVIALLNSLFPVKPKK